MTAASSHAADGVSTIVDSAHHAAADGGRPPDEAGDPPGAVPLDPAQRTLIAAVRCYRLLLSPWLGNACRFEPTCSAYAIEAIERRGALFGSALAAGRVLRCQPMCRGGHDPVPAGPPGTFSARVRSRPHGGHRDDPETSCPESPP